MEINDCLSPGQSNDKMVLHVKDEDGKLKEVKICGLSRAAATNNAYKCKELLDKVVDNPEFLRTALRCRDASFGYNVFHWAAKYGSANALKVLLKVSTKQGDVHLNLDEGSKTYNMESNEVDPIPCCHNSPLHVACQNGSLDCVKLLVKYGMSPEPCTNRSRSALHLACEELHLPIIKFLVEESKLSCKDINHPNGEYGGCDTPLLRLIRTNAGDQDSKVEAIKFLLAHGANPLVRGCFGATTVQRATLSRNPEVLRVILDHLKKHCTRLQTQDLINQSNTCNFHKPLDLALEDRRGKDLSVIQLLLSRGAKPSLKNFDQVCRQNDDFNILEAFLETPKILDNLVNSLNSESFSCNGDNQWTPPFLSIISSEMLTPKQKLEWIDYVMEKVQPDTCYIRDHVSKQCLTPLTMLVRQLGKVISSFEHESARDKKEVPYFPFQLVRKFVEGGSNVNSHVISKNESIQRKRRKCGKYRRSTNDKKEDKTLHPLTFARDNIYIWNDHEGAIWKKTLNYLVEQGTLFDNNTDRPPYLSLTARALALLTESGVLLPEFIPFNEIYQEMKSQIRKVSHGDDNGDEVDPQDLMNHFDEFFVYIGALIDELGPGIIAKHNSQMLCDIKAIMPEKFRSAPSLKLLSRHAVRKSITEAKNNKLKRNMNSLIDCFPEDSMPRHLKQKYLKMSETHKAVSNVEAEFGTEDFI